VSLAERASAELRPVSSLGRIGTDNGSGQSVALMVASPIGAGNEPIGIAAVLIMGSAAALDPERVSEQLRWGAGWLEAIPWAKTSAERSLEVARAASCLDVVATIGEQPRLQGMAFAIANDLATRLGCDRVSVGILKRNGSVALRAISHSASFRRQARLVDAIENAMEEALDQHSSIAYPPLPTTENTVTMAHRALSELVKGANASAITVVLAGSKGDLVGAITFERHRDRSLDTEDLKFAEAVAALLGPIMEIQLRANRLVAGRVVDHIGDGVEVLIGPGRPTWKIGVIGVLAAALGLVMAVDEHRVTGKAVLEGEVQRAAVAPFDGYIKTAPVRAGDVVKSGTLLAQLDDRDLVLDRLKWQAEREKLILKKREAIAKHDRPAMVVTDSQIRQAESQLALAEEKLARSQIVAPFDGVVVSGDLSQMLGSPVEKGKTLFELAPLDSYRLIIHVSERDVRYIFTPQKGFVALAGTVANSLPIVLTKITPVTVAEEGRNSFRVEARLVEGAPHLRPGMEGVAKIYAGERPLLWIWTHAVIEWLRLAAWKYLP
jgi:hypothetical protein